MIEKPVKSVLQSLSLVSVVLLGGYSLYHVAHAAKIRAEGREWGEINGAWYAARCEQQLPDDTITRVICQEAWGRKSYYDSAPEQAMIEARNSFGLALLAPLALVVFLLLSRFRRRGGA